MTKSKKGADLPHLRVDVVELGAHGRRDWVRCEIGSHLKFSTARLESYFFAQWQPVLYDALLVAAAVEFCDRVKRRPARGWGRNIELRIPVHEPERWQRLEVAESLTEALNFLTGDHWTIEFKTRAHAESIPRQGQFLLSNDVAAVIPFSEGLDSRAVAGLLALELGQTLVRVRMGTKDFDGAASRREPFTSVPYSVRHPQFVESTARSRGFKFAMLSGLAAFLANANRVIVPESGQGALGPTLVPVGQAYTDYRSHPLFTARMEKFVAALLETHVRYDFPRLWHTKGETLARFVKECENGTVAWTSTWSCWQQNRHVSVANKKRQCGICAACMLRRLSVHAAALNEPDTAYVWENLRAPDFNAGAAPDFDKKKITGAMKEYAIAGALHLDHLAGLRHSDANTNAFNLSAFQLAQACGLPESDVRSRLERMLIQHETEWKDFMNSLGPQSFVNVWVGGVQ